MALLLVTGQSDLQTKVDFMHDVIKRRKAQDQTVKVVISSATDAKRKFVEGVCGVHGNAFSSSSRLLPASASLYGLGMTTTLRK